jgi:hypothetical protein
MREVGDSVQLGLDGNGDLLLDFFGGTAGPLGDDPDVLVGHIGVRLNRQVVKGNDAPD